MNAKLRLGVLKRLEGDSLDPLRSSQPTGVFARIVPAEGRGKAIQTLVPIGADGSTSTIDVPSGRVSVQVRLPSGEILTEDMEIGEGQEASMVLQSRPSPHEWMSWPRYVSVMSGQKLSATPTGDRLDHLKPRLWVRGKGGDLGHVAKKLWQEDVDRSQGLFSCTFQGSSPHAPDWIPQLGDRHYLAVDISGGHMVLATIPLPWSKERPRTRVQVLVMLSEGGTPDAAEDVDVLVHDDWLAPMLGYLHSGDLAAARAFAPSVTAEAQNMLSAKSENPIAAAAGAYLLLQTRSLHQLHDWPENLASRFDWLPDGAIIHATQLLRSRSAPSDLEGIRHWFLAAARRGAPVFTEGVRLLGDGLRLLGSWDQSSAGSKRRQRGTDAFEALMEWVETLESATRPDALFTVLAGKDETLRSLVKGFGQ